MIGPKYSLQSLWLLIKNASWIRERDPTWIFEEIYNQFTYLIFCGGEKVMEEKEFQSCN